MRRAVAVQRYGHRNQSSVETVPNDYTGATEQGTAEQSDGAGAPAPEGQRGQRGQSRSKSIFTSRRSGNSGGGYVGRGNPFGIN